MTAVFEECLTFQGITTKIWWSAGFAFTAIACTKFYSAFSNRRKRPCQAQRNQGLYYLLIGTMGFAYPPIYSELLARGLAGMNCANDAFPAWLTGSLAPAFALSWCMGAIFLCAAHVTFRKAQMSSEAAMLSRRKRKVRAFLATGAALVAIPLLFFAWITTL
jgi:hypothetical protein